MEEDVNTSYLYSSTQEYLGRPEKHRVQPRLFVCFEHEVMEFPLAGHQTMGRPVDDHIPDIPVTNKYVSRNHGYFDTTDDKVTYTAEDALNGTIFRRKMLTPGETVELWDGDELIIPVADKGDGADVMLVCAIIENRINIWRDLELAARDALTGLSGRNTFRTWYLRNHSFRKDEKLSLFILDIDNFKRINDVYGHSAGDSALKLLAEELRLAVGTGGFVCRWGGDEFVGLMEREASEAKAALEELSRRINSVKIDDVFRITVSAGVAGIRSKEEAPDIDGLVILADQALYRAKEYGKNRICVYGKYESK